jgi:antirestriction protein ArdC
MSGNYERITAQILAALDTDLPPWRRPWRTLRAAGASGIPCNAITGRSYRGINSCLLLTRFDADARFLTYRQAQEHGGNVRRGEHGQTVVFWQKRQYKTRDETGEEETRDGLLMRCYTVFNIAQTQNVRVPVPRNAPEPLPPPPTIINVYSALGTSVRHAGDHAFYSPTHDSITMPVPEAFSSAEAYSATGLHEAVHATGHESRLKREFGKRFGDMAYSAEELVAELGSAMLCAELGVDSALECHASYIQHWKKLLQGDSRAIITAASRAQAAADFVLAKIRPGTLAPVTDETAEELQAA